jgi:hypothetical protein
VKAVKGAAIGLSFASAGALLVNFAGLTQNTLLVLLYMYVALGVLLTVDVELPSLLHRLVLVSEGEAIKMRKLVSGEKYKIKGEVEKLQ